MNKAIALADPISINWNGTTHIGMICTKKSFLSGLQVTSSSFRHSHPRGSAQAYGLDRQRKINLEKRRWGRRLGRHMLCCRACSCLICHKPCWRRAMQMRQVLLRFDSVRLLLALDPSSSGQGAACFPCFVLMAPNIHFVGTSFYLEG